MVLIWIDKQFCWYATQACCIKGSKTLVCIDTVVHLAVYAKDRCIPLVYKFVWRVRIGALGTVGLYILPIGVVILPVREPCLLRICIHRLKVECSVVCNECLETLVVMACKIVYRETSETCTYTSQAVLVYIRQVVGGIVDGR